MNHETQQAGQAAVFGARGGIGAALVAALGERGWRVTAGSRTGAPVPGAGEAFAFDLTHEAGIATVAQRWRADPPDLVIVATGVLTLPGGSGPEKSFRHLDPEALVESYRINAVGPALIAKHVLPLLRRDRRTVFAALGARVGSIGDNRLGGWYGYRASKAALAMLIRTLAVEMARTHPAAIIAGLHPGTVDTRLSAPFRHSVAPERLFDPAIAAGRLIGVIEGLSASDSGAVLDWKGETVPP